ncbi:unnamed protein product [Mytilus coruscus]|uniref:G-protein coupled receptors family 1 profile domain-containing protein n=1 Tax=Mytilus coruscus TaxID=42192 RepID=A0A6J8BU77_MYTCO|nr:unnamed protein product [Mytilus coruscus]
MKRSYLRVVSSSKGAVVGFVVIQVGMACYLVYDVTEELKPCTAASSLTLSTVFVVNTPIVFLCTMIVGIYVVVMWRIVRQHSAMQTAGKGSAGLVAAMKRRTRTLGIIIVLSLVGNMPNLFCLSFHYLRDQQHLFCKVYSVQLSSSFKPIARSDNLCVLHKGIQRLT